MMTPKGSSIEVIAATQDTIEAGSSIKEAIIGKEDVLSYGKCLPTFLLTFSGAKNGATNRAVGYNSSITYIVS